MGEIRESIYILGKREADDSPFTLKHREPVIQLPQWRIKVICKNDFQNKGGYCKSQNEFR